MSHYEEIHTWNVSDNMVVVHREFGLEVFPGLQQRERNSVFTTGVVK